MTTIEQTPSNSASSPSEKLDLRKVPGTRANSELVRYADEHFEKAKKYRQQFEQQWYVNLAFYFGRHYVQWSMPGANASSRLFEPKVPPWRVRLVVNKVRSMVRKELAKLTKEQPMGFVVPQSSDETDLLAAQAGESLAEYFWREKKMTRHVRRAAFWTILTGNGFIKDWWDPDSITENYQGDIFLERLTPWHLFVPDIQEEELENQPYVFHAMAKNADWVAKTYKADVNADVMSNTGILEDKFLQALGIKESSAKDLTYVKEMWIKPCKKFEDGAVICWAGNKVLWLEEGWPYKHLEYPFTKFDHIPTGRFYSESTVTDLIPLQKEYNKTRSQLIEAKNRMSKPQLMAPKGSVDVNKMTSEPGLVIFYQPGFNPPTPLPLPQIPQYVFEELNRTAADMGDIASQHEVSKGQTPPGVSAATAISYLQEQDDTVLSLSISSLEEGVERITRHLLSHVSQFWEEERQVQVVGENGQFEVFMFNGQSLHNNLKFTVQAGSSTPRSLAAKQAFIMELGKMGWIPPDKAMRYLNMAETGRMYEEMQVDVRQAQRENLKLSLGAPIPVNTWDNHVAHIMEHDNYRKRQTYESSDPQIMQMFEDHVQQHKVFVLVRKGIPMPMIQQAMTNPLQLDALLYGVQMPQTQGQPVGAPAQQGQPNGAVASQ
jgi:hypothetical protein